MAFMNHGRLSCDAATRRVTWQHYTTARIETFDNAELLDLATALANVGQRGFELVQVVQTGSSTDYYFKRNH